MGGRFCFLTVLSSLITGCRKEAKVLNVHFYVALPSSENIFRDSLNACLLGPSRAKIPNYSNWKFCSLLMPEFHALESAHCSPAFHTEKSASSSQVRNGTYQQWGELHRYLTKNRLGNSHFQYHFMGELHVSGRKFLSRQAQSLWVFAEVMVGSDQNYPQCPWPGRVQTFIPSL